MADVTTPGLTPSAGGLNYSDYEEKLRKAAATTRQVGGTGQSLTGAELAAKTIKDTMGGIGKTYGGLASTAIENYRTQEADQQKKAERAASALEMVGTSTLSGIKNLETAQASIRNRVQSASDSWGAAAEKADEYVKASRGRVSEVLAKMDELNTQISKDRDFAKAHAMQSSVQAALGSMKTEERSIAETYGTDSKEYQQFQASKMSTLATVQSNLHATYQQLAEDQAKTFLNATSDAYTKSNMYVGFQEQQHVEMLKFSSESKATYAIQAAQLDVNIESMKMSGMENLSNWIIETPTFTMDSTPLVALIADLGQVAMNQYISYKTMKRTTKGGGSKDLLKQLGSAAAIGFGTAFGGPLGGMAAGAATGALTKKKTE